MGFFSSRRKPSETELERVRAKAIRQAPPAPPARLETGSLPVDFTDTISGFVDEEILDIRNVPAGNFVSMVDLGVAQIWQNKLAVIETSDTTHLLVTPPVYSRPAMFETMRMLKLKKPGRAITVKRISTQLLEAVVDRWSKSTTAAIAESEVEIDAKDLIRRALALRASDVHIEARADFAEVKFRIAGRLTDQPQISRKAALSICSVLYNTTEDSARSTHWTSETVLDTSIDWELDVGGKMRQVQIRFSSGPMNPKGCFHAVMRLLTMEAAEVPLKDVGYTEGQLRAIERGLIGAQGMVLLVGPTNSGKSTSMQAMLTRTRYRRGNIKMITIEKPVEYVIEHAVQMAVPDDREELAKKGGGSVFNAFIKGTLRQDPDVVMVGEIRDREEASSVEKLVIAGRKLFTTLHVFKAIASFERLRQLGIPEDILFMEGFISLVIFQRLVPNLCNCSLPWSQAIAEGLVDDEDLIERVQRVTEPQDNVRYRNPAGCKACMGTGISGRSICAEVLVPDEEFLAHLRAGNRPAALAHWYANAELQIDGMPPTAICHGISKMRQGIHDPRDVEQQISELAIPRVPALPGTQAGERHRPFRMGRE